MIDFEIVKTALDKLAVYTTILRNNEQVPFLITRNKSIINFFNPGLSCAIYGESADLCTLDAYDIRYDKLVTLNTQEVLGMSYIGVPLGISPDMFLYSDVRDEFTTDRMHNVQQEFLDKVKYERDNGHYGDSQVPPEIQNKITHICHFLCTEYGVDTDTHEFFNFLDPRYFYYNIVSNRALCDDLIELYNTLLFSPVILNVEGLESSTIEQRKAGVSAIMPRIIDGSIFNDLKAKWVTLLKQKVSENIVKFQQELNDVEGLYIKEWSDLIYNDSVESNRGWSRDRTDALALFLYDNYERCSIVLDQDINFGNYATVIPEDILTMLTDWSLPSKLWFLRETYKHFTSMASVQGQYRQLIDRLSKLDIDQELAAFDDYRLYLRYWPEGLDIIQEFHTHVRPFTTLEYNVVKALVQEGIEFNIDEIFTTVGDYVNSVINNLEKYTLDVCEKRLQQITAIANTRIQEIRDEIQPMYEELSDAEKVEFDRTIESLGDIELYRSEINSKGGIVNALSYWPVSLYPVPGNILRV